MKNLSKKDKNIILSDEDICHYILRTPPPVNKKITNVKFRLLFKTLVAAHKALIKFTDLKESYDLIYNYRFLASNPYRGDDGDRQLQEMKSKLDALEVSPGYDPVERQVFKRK